MNGKMINESKYRSPKWLRNFVDFEINTGEDIKGNISKGELRRKWIRKWDGVDKNLFKEFYEKTFPNEYSGRIYSRDLDSIYNKWIGDFEIWNKYDNWIIDRNREEERKKELEKEINNLFDRIVIDFNTNRYRDKYETSNNNGKVSFHYTFENGDKFTLVDRTIIYESNGSRITYSVGLLFANKFTSLANEIINSNARNRPDGNYNYNQRARYKPKEKNKYSDHPKGDIYNKLKETIEARKTQLKNLKKDDPDREALQNELNAAEGRLKKMQSEYKFEKLLNFSDLFKNKIKFI